MFSFFVVSTQKMGNQYNVCRVFFLCFHGLLHLFAGRFVRSAFPWWMGVRLPFVRKKAFKDWSLVSAIIINYHQNRTNTEKCFMRNAHFEPSSDNATQHEEEMCLKIYTSNWLHWKCCSNFMRSIRSENGKNHCSSQVPQVQMICWHLNSVVLMLLQPSTERIYFASMLKTNSLTFPLLQFIHFIWWHNQMNRHRIVACLVSFKRPSPDQTLVRLIGYEALSFFPSVRLAFVYSRILYLFFFLIC